MSAELMEEVSWAFRRIVAGVGVFWAIFQTARLSYTRLYPRLETLQHERASLATVCLVHNSYASVNGLVMTVKYCLPLLFGDPGWSIVIPGLYSTGLVSISFFIYDGWMSHLWQPWSLANAVHHAFSSCMLLACCHMKIGHSWVAYGLATELSSVFLSCRTIISMLHDKESQAYSMATTLFGLTFLAIRSLPLPLLLRTWVMFTYNNFCGPGPLPPVPALILGNLTPLHAAMNAHWTVAVIQNALKHRRKPAAKPKSNSNAESNGVSKAAEKAE
jgi:signal transduction histidine kinase